MKPSKAVSLSHSSWSNKFSVDVIPCTSSASASAYFDLKVIEAFTTGRSYLKIVPPTSSLCFSMSVALMSRLMVDSCVV